MGISNGKINTPIEIGDVRSSINSGSYDIGTNGRSLNINQWSYYKPISYSKIGRLTEDEIKYKNDGFTIYTFNHPVDLYNSVSEGNSWKYTRPTGGSTAPYRISDFIGYYHNAKAWMNPTFSKTELASSETIRCYMTNQNNSTYYSELGWVIDLNWIINNFNTFSVLNKNELNIGFLLSTSQSGARGVYWYNLGNYQDLEEQLGEKGLVFRALSTFGQNSYYVVPCLSNASGVNAGEAVYIRNDDYITVVGTFFALPCDSPTLIKINTSSGSSSINEIEFIEGTNNRVYSSGAYDVMVDSVSFFFRNGNSGDTRVYYKVEAGGAINTTVLENSSVLVRGNSTSSEIFVENKRWTSALEISDIGIYLSITYWIQGGVEKRYKYVLRQGDNEK